ncbi:MAG: hypothetical protein C0504_13650 [Candidatus Solibacter sp.]|nr:hypothetical protein [Candidatus Solibacter sp.]
MPDNPRLARAWGAMAWAVLIHVLDEAWNNFLVVYNPAAIALTGRYPWLPLPVFQFEYWLGGLLLAVIGLFLLKRQARRATTPIVIAAYILAAAMAVNAVWHTALTIAGHTPTGMEFTRPMPGFWSSPLLLAASIWLWREARRAGSARSTQLRPAGVPDHP